jgi:hypothetical protein
MNKIYTVLLFSFFTGNTIVTPKNNIKLTVVKEPNLGKNNNTDTLVYNTDNFKFASKAFNFYNKNVDTITLLQLIKVCDYYGLNDEHNFKMCVGQMLVETGGKHYKNGKVVVGYGGHIGISQISPTSGLAVMKKIVTNDEFNIIKKLSNDTLMVKPKTHNESVKFLSDLNKNLAFWGYIMSRNIKIMHNIESALVRYNAGPGGYQSYVNSGGSVSNHQYIIKIKNKLSKIN